MIRQNAEGSATKPKPDAKSATSPTKKNRAAVAAAASSNPDATALHDQILVWLDEAKAEDVVSIPLEGKSALGDFMIVASGRNDRHVGAIAEQLREKIKGSGETRVRVEGLKTCDWVLIDAADIIVHVFRPEVREFYNLEKMWQSDLRADEPAGGDASGEPPQH